ncbi:MAG: hypothetical protein ACOVOV_15075, partial [Dolichospermum sp.]
STATNSNVIISNSVPTLVSSTSNLSYDFCFNGENIKQTIRITNTGAGPATNIKVRQYRLVSGSYWGQNRFDTTANWEVRNSSGVVMGKVTNFTVISGNTTNHPGPNCTSLTRFDEVEGSINVTLAPGDYIEYDVWTTTINLSCSNCPADDLGPRFAIRTNLFYSNQCGATAYTTGYVTSIGRANVILNPVLTGPIDIAGGQSFTLDVNVSQYATNNHPSGKGSTYFAIPLSGTNIVANATSVVWGAYTLPVFTRNDTLLVGPFPQNIGYGGREFRLPLIVNCGSGGAITINSRFLNKYDSTCSPIQSIGCRSFTTILHCTVPCPKGGATPANFTLRRINFGQVDNNNDGVPDASGSLNMSLVKDHNSVNGDTLMGTWNIRVTPNVEPTDPNVGQNFNHLYIDFKLRGTNLGDAGSLSALPNAVATVYPAGGGASFTCTVSPTITSQIAHYDFSSCKANWVGGDSLVVNALYTVNQINGDRYNDANSGGQTYFVTDNYVYTTYVPQATPTTAPINASTYTCDTYNDYNQIARIWVAYSIGNNQAITGCNNSLTASTILTLRDWNEGDIMFPYEYRNFFIPDTLMVSIPAGFVYRPTTAKLNTTTTISDANVVQVGNTLYFTNLKSLFTPYGGTLIPADEASNYAVNFSIDPTCSAVAGTFSGTTKTMGVGNGLNTPLTNYGLGNSATDNTRLTSDASAYVYNPALPVLAGGGTVVTNTGAASWNIQLQNQANNADAANSFLYIQPVN